MMFSKAEGDVISALQFFPIAYSCKIKDINDCLRKMLLLVWNQSPTILKALIEVINYAIIHCYQSIDFKGIIF